jgi:hypothetical protein
MALADRYTLRGILLQPKLLYIASGETEDFGHNGRCGDNTAIFITTDHGRGALPLETSKQHARVSGSRRLSYEIN